MLSLTVLLNTTALLKAMERLKASVVHNSTELLMTLVVLNVTDLLKA